MEKIQNDRIGRMTKQQGKREKRENGENVSVILKTKECIYVNMKPKEMTEFLQTRSF